MRFCLSEFPQCWFFVPRITVRKHVQLCSGHAYWSIQHVGQHLDPVRVTPGEIFCPHYKMEEFKNATVTSRFGFVLEKNSVRSHYRAAKTSVSKKISVHTRTKCRRFQIPPLLTSVFEKLHFRDGCLAAEMKLRSLRKLSKDEDFGYSQTPFLFTIFIM